jgi:hypothetical protein
LPPSGRVARIGNRAGLSRPLAAGSCGRTGAP